MTDLRVPSISDQATTPNLFGWFQPAFFCISSMLTEIVGIPNQARVHVDLEACDQKLCKDGTRRALRAAARNLKR